MGVARSGGGVGCEDEVAQIHSDVAAGVQVKCRLRIGAGQRYWWTSSVGYLESLPARVERLVT
jgi:hypothetical protein